MREIVVTPTEGGWMVRSDAIENELFFEGGGSAESAAIRLAYGLADAGENARVNIYLRDGSLGRQFAIPSLRLVGAASPKAIGPARTSG